MYSFQNRYNTSLLILRIFPPVHAILESATECQHMYIAVNVVNLKRQYHEMSTSCFVKASYKESKTAKSFTARTVIS